jgi:hypothetical protein
MNKEPETLPLALTMPLRIPTWWTPEQAFAVFEMINDLRNAIWQCYQLQLLDEYRKQCKEAPDICMENTDGSAF